MVADQEPRYRLVDANGNVVGSLFAESDGTLKLQEGTSGNDNELALSTQGALEVEQISESESPVVKTWAQSGATADDRLSNAVTAATQEDTILLEPATFNSTTISKNVALVASAAGLEGSADIADGETWSLTTDVTVIGLDVFGTLRVEGSITSHVRDCTVRGTGDIRLANGTHLLSHIAGAGDVVFESGASGGEIGIVSGTVTVTDNDGGNRIL